MVVGEFIYRLSRSSSFSLYMDLFNSGIYLQSLENVYINDKEVIILEIDILINKMLLNMVAVYNSCLCKAIFFEKFHTP